MWCKGAKSRCAGVGDKDQESRISTRAPEICRLRLPYHNRFSSLTGHDSIPWTQISSVHSQLYLTREFEGRSWLAKCKQGMYHHLLHSFQAVAPNLHGRWPVPHHPHTAYHTPHAAPLPRPTSTPPPRVCTCEPSSYSMPYDGATLVLMSMSTLMLTSLRPTTLESLPVIPSSMPACLSKRPKRGDERCDPPYSGGTRVDVSVRLWAGDGPKVGVEARRTLTAASRLSNGYLGYHLSPTTTPSICHDAHIFPISVSPLRRTRASQLPNFPASQDCDFPTFSDLNRNLPSLGDQIKERPCL